MMCSNFTCIAAGGPQPVGAACTTQTQCSGSQPFCSTNANYKDGYCSSTCQFDNDCPSGSHCAQKSNGTGSCLKNCVGDSDCRSGYLCFNQDDDDQNSKECAPAGTGTRGIGQSCTGVYECDGDQEAYCITNWPSGYCSLECNAISACPTGYGCVSDDFFGTSGYCVVECTTNTQCRSGYTCQDFNAPIGGTNGRGCMAP